MDNIQLKYTQRIGLFKRFIVIPFIILFIGWWFYPLIAIISQWKDICAEYKACWRILIYGDPRGANIPTRIDVIDEKDKTL